MHVPALVKCGADEMSKRLWFDGTFLLHLVHVEAVSESFAEGGHVRTEAGQANVGLFCDWEHLREGK